jgi:ElaB/YqjD/DUF883 family membrane-anchored ribosome-binding protein
MNVSQDYEAAQQQTVADLQRFISSTGELLRTLNDEGIESTNVLRERVAVGIEGMQQQLDAVVETLIDTSEAAESFLRQNPWLAVGLGGAAGLALAFAITRASQS